MRYDKKIEIVKPSQEIYNEITGDYELIDQQSIYKYANINNLGIERTNLVFGNLDTNGKIVRLKEVYNEEIETIIIDEVEHIVNKTLLLKGKTAFIVMAKP